MKIYILIIGVFIILSVTPVNAGWGNPALKFCRVITLTENNGTARIDTYPNIPIDSSGWIHKPYTDSIRIFSGSDCNNAITERESDIWNITQTAGLMNSFNVVFLGNFTSSTGTTYLMYYDNETAGSPSYTDKITVSNGGGGDYWDIDGETTKYTNLYLFKTGGRYNTYTIGNTAYGYSAGYDFVQIGGNGIFDAYPSNNAVCSILYDGVVFSTISCVKTGAVLYNFTYNFYPKYWEEQLTGTGGFGADSYYIKRLGTDTTFIMTTKYQTAGGGDFTRFPSWEGINRGYWLLSLKGDTNLYITMTLGGSTTKEIYSDGKDIYPVRNINNNMTWLYQPYTTAELDFTHNNGRMLANARENPLILSVGTEQTQSAGNCWTYTASVRQLWIPIGCLYYTNAFSFI